MAPTGFDADLMALSKAVTDMRAAAEQSDQLTKTFTANSGLDANATYVSDLLGLGSFMASHDYARGVMVRTMSQIAAAIAVHARSVRSAALLYQQNDQKNKDAVMAAGCE